MRRILAIAAVFSALFCQVALAQNSAPPGMPANVQAIMKRLESGIKPTPAEQKTLNDYMAAVAASAGASAGAIPGGATVGNRASLSASATNGGVNPHQSTMTSSGVFKTGNGIAQNGCRPAAKAIGFGTTPSRDAYVAMAKDAMRTYRAHLVTSAQSSLNSALAYVPTPGFGAAIAPIMVLHGNGSAAVVSAAYSAQKDPSDATTANNLGAILRGMHDYARAAIALQYAASLAPKSALIANNLGWLAFGQGDQKTAGTFFAAAITANSKLSPALLGQGLIDQCSGKSAQALPLLRASIANGFSDAAMDAIESAENDLASANKSSSDTASPDVYGQSGGSGSMPDWKDPPFDSDATKLASDLEAKPSAIRTYIDTYITGIENDAVNTEKSLGPKIKGASTTGTGRSLSFTRGDAKEAFEIGDILGILARDEAQIVDKFSKDAADDIERDGCHSCVGAPPIQPKCSAQGQFRSIHSGLYSEEQSEWTQLRKTMQDVYGFTDPLIKQIQDSNAAKVEDASRRLWVATAIVGFTTMIPRWEQEAWFAMDPDDCKGAPPKPFVAGVLKAYPIDPTKCKSGAFSLNWGFANLNANCSEMTLTIGEGVVGALDWKFAPDYTKMADGSLRATGTDWSNDQITIFVGAGGGTSGPVSANGAIGEFVTFQGGNVTDMGGQAAVGGTIGSAGDLDQGANGSETPLQYGETMTGKVGMASGPDVSLSGATRVGGACGYSC